MRTRNVHLDTTVRIKDCTWEDVSHVDVMDIQRDATMGQEYVLTASIILQVTTVNCAKKVTLGMLQRGHVAYVLVLSPCFQTALPQDVQVVGEI